MDAISVEYFKVMEDVSTDRTGFEAINVSMVQYIVRMHRWVHGIFPWNLGVACAQHTDVEIKDIYDLIQIHPTPKRLTSLASYGPVALDYPLPHLQESSNKPSTSSDALSKQPAMNHPWQEFVHKAGTAVEKMWLDEPWEIEKIRWGLINSGAGSGKQYFSDLVHQDIYLELISPMVFYGLLEVFIDYPSTYKSVKMMTRIILRDSFNAFKFLGDLGLAEVYALSEEYFIAIDDIATGPDEFFFMTQMFSIYINRLKDWVYSIFPWNLGAALPQCTDSDITSIYNITKEHPTTPHPLGASPDIIDLSMDY
jgi:hypothetical protein